VSEILCVTGRNLLSQEETFCDRKSPPVTVRDLRSHEETSCCKKKHVKIDIKMDEHNAKEEIEIAENVPFLRNAYKFFKNAMNPYWKGNSDNGKLAGLIFNKNSY
jgi:hypothetical protein